MNTSERNIERFIIPGTILLPGAFSHDCDGDAAVRGKSTQNAVDHHHFLDDIPQDIGEHIEVLVIHFYHRMKAFRTHFGLQQFRFK